MYVQVECEPPSTIAVSLTKYTMVPDGDTADVQLSLEQVAGSNAIAAIELQAGVSHVGKDDASFLRIDSLMASDPALRRATCRKCGDSRGALHLGT